MAQTTFDYAGYKRAFEALDIPTLLTYYADDAEWLEYRTGLPVRAPHHMAGKETIRDQLQGAADYGIKVAISDEVIGDGRIAFCMVVTTPENLLIIENAILHLQDGKIIRHSEVEAWDEGAS